MSRLTALTAFAILVTRTPPGGDDLDLFRSADTLDADQIDLTILGVLAPRGDDLDLCRSADTLDADRTHLTIHRCKALGRHPRNARSLRANRALLTVGVRRAASGRGGHLADPGSAYLTRIAIRVGGAAHGRTFANEHTATRLTGRRLAVGRGGGLAFGHRVAADGGVRIRNADCRVDRVAALATDHHERS